MAASGCGYDSLSLRRFRFCPGCVDEGELWSASRGKRWFPHGGGWNPKSQSKMDEHPKMNGIFTRVAQCFWAIPKCLLVAGWLKHHTFQGLLSWITRIYPGQNNQLPLGTIPSAQTWVFFFKLFVDCAFLGVKTRNQPESRVMRHFIHVRVRSSSLYHPSSQSSPCCLCLKNTTLDCKLAKKWWTIGMAYVWCFQILDCNIKRLETI